MIMTLLQNPEDGATVRVPQADEYPGYPDWVVVREEEWPTLAMLQDALWDQAKLLRASKLLLAQTSKGVAQADPESKSNINGLVSMAMLAKQMELPYSEVFTMADNSLVTLSADEMIQFGMEVGMHIAVVHARSRDLRSEIYGAATRAELEAIDIEAGW